VDTQNTPKENADPMKKYCITLTKAERERLEAMLTKDKAAARKLTRARIMLKADRGPDGPAWTDEQISQALDVTSSTVANVRERFVLESFEVALAGHSTRNTRRPKLDGECEARLIAALCGPAPAGSARWSLRLLADQAVELDITAEPVSHETVRKTLKANRLKPWLKKEWCIPPEHNGEFVCHMEDILEVYRRPLDPQRPLLCLDELSYQLISETRTPQPLQHNRTRRYDYEYKREGVVNLFMVFAPLLGQRYVRVTKQRTARDWAHLIQYLVEVLFPDAECIVLVMDNLNTHVGGSLYEAFPPTEARRLLSKLEIHYTPKHGSWLNMAEIELSVLSQQCLDRRLGTERVLAREVTAWMNARNASTTTVNWQFTTADARIKLKRLYPVLETASGVTAGASLADVAAPEKHIARHVQRQRQGKSQPEVTAPISPAT